MIIKPKDNLSLLSLAEGVGIEIDSGCKNGLCERCATDIMLVKFGSKKIETVLACQYIPDQEVSLANYKLRSVANEKVFRAKVEKVERYTEQLICIFFRFPRSVELDFIGGMFIDLAVDGLKRSYSILDVDNTAKEFSILVKLVPGGAMSAVLAKLGTGQLVSIFGPKGSFGVDSKVDSLTRDHVFICTGTGISPVVSMVRQLDSMRERGEFEKDITVIWGVRFREEIIFSESDFGTARLVTTVSSKKDIQSKSLYVQDILFSEKNLDLKNSIFYCVGSPPMVKQCRDKLKDAGVQTDSINYEIFTS
jgi:ferredoxin-NADP reductase